ncbi:MAG: Holliday junction resolvase RuvX [Negativicutes bacterium]|nr:Holliday junction resolvase RuvX [Negativicutes bacterium]
MAAGRILALDVGEKNIGLALSDAGRVFGQPYGVLHRRGWRQEQAELKEIVEREQVSEIVVGLAVSLDGGEGEAAARCRAYGEKIMACGLVERVVFWDERLTSRAADRQLVAADVSRKKRRQINDKIAAALILQGYLDRQRTVKITDCGGKHD